MIDQRISVPADDVIHRIKFQNCNDCRRKAHRIHIPHDRSRPDLNLQNNIDDLYQIPEKNGQRTCQIGHRKDEDKHAERVIYKLNGIDAGKQSVHHIHAEHEADKKDMYEQTRDYLHHRKRADPEHHLLDQIVVFKKRVRPRRHRVREIKPGNQAGDKPEHIRNGNPLLRGLRSRVQCLLEYKPVHKDGDNRLDKCPDSSKVGARKFSLEIIFCETPDQFSAS